MSILEIDNLTKRFDKVTAVDGLSFSVKENTLFGFIGRNGAGKTTTMRMVVGLLKPDGGEIRIQGKPVVYGHHDLHRHVGYLPDVPMFYGYMNPMEYLTLCGNILGLPREETMERSRELLEMVGLSDVKRRIRGFSRGMNQRLGIAQALLGRPRLLLCDEPTSALDPLGRRELLEILSTVKRETTVLFSTHILSDVERIADEIAVLEKGKLVLQGSLKDLKSAFPPNEVRLEVENGMDGEEVRSALRTRPFLKEVRGERNTLELTLSGEQGDAEALLRWCIDQGIRIRRYEMMEPTLEKLFLEVIG